MRLSKPTMLSATALSLSAMALTMPAQAQDTVEASEASEPSVIVVTGSRISRGDFVSPSPIVTVAASTITDAGRATIDDYLRDLPQFTAGQGDFSNDSNGGTAGRATLNLRGLGPQRNLVLMDGQRLMSSGTDGAIDINTIPSLAIGGIEIISGGASATYGSDALSGVVNFRTRRDLDGIEVTGQISDSGDRDSFSKQFGAAFGTDLGGGRGYLLLSAEHVDRGGVQVNEREFFLTPGASSFIPQGRSRIGPNWLSVNDDGTIFNNITGVGYNGPSDLPYLRGDREAQTGSVGYHGSFDNYLQVPLKRTALFAAGDYEIFDDVEVYFQGIYTTGEARNIGAAPNVAGNPWRVTVPGTNPFLVALRAANPGEFGADGSTIGTFQARLTQVGSRIYLTENDTTQVKLGMQGGIGQRDLNWDVHASYGRAVNKDRTISGAGSFRALQQLLDAPDGGNSLCAGGYNPFGGTAPLSAACVSFIERTPLNETTLEQWIVEGTLEGAAFTLPAGEARFALTSQFRRNSYDFVPDAEIEAGNLANLSVVLPTSGTIEAVEIGGELFLPLIEGAPFAQEVNLTLGYRFADYNLAGSNSTYKAELDARISNAILLRGGYQRAVRAPNVGEFFLAGESRVVGIGSPPNAGDPCDQRSNPSGDVLALCQFEGVAANYRASTVSTPAFNRGNPNLDPETADTFTAGFVVDVPLGDAQLQFSTDYYSISIKDAISAISASDSLQQCYNLQGTTPGFDPAQYLADNFFCGNFTRSGIGELSPIDQPVLNLGSLKTAGIDFATSLRIPADSLAWGGGNGSITLTNNLNYQLSYKIANFEGTPELDYSGTISTTTQESFPEWRSLTSLAIETGPLSLIGTWRYTSGMEDRSTVLNPASLTLGTPAYSYFDLTAKVEIMDQFELFGGINNIGDKGPPVVGDSLSATNAGTYDVIGRTFFAGVRARF